MQRHQRRLHAEAADQKEEDQAQRPLIGQGQTGEKPSRLEFEGTDSRLEPDRAGKQDDPSAQGVCEIDASGAQSLFGAAMDYEGIGGQGQHLVEDDEGDHVPGKGDADGGADAEAEKAEEAAAIGGPFEVADGVESRHEPQSGGEGREEQRHGIGVEDQIEPLKQRETRLVKIPLLNPPQQIAHEHDLEGGPPHVQRDAKAVSLFADGKDQNRRHERGHQDENWQTSPSRHGQTCRSGRSKGAPAAAICMGISAKKPKASAARARVKALHCSRAPGGRERGVSC